MKKGFSLVEMLVVIGIIAVLIGASIGAYSKMTAGAERAKCQELVSNTATALTVLFQKEGVWPRVLRSQGSSDGELDASAALPLAKYMSLTTNSDGSQLSGLDRFGIVSPWAAAVIKRKGSSASVSDKVGDVTVKDHILHYALDLDGDGIIDGASVGGESVAVRATAIVWCCGKDGKMEEYSKGIRSDDVYSWTKGQTQNVK
jgi:prepilin-type N-terminal cleavage/methylation domain-containing protein